MKDPAEPGDPKSGEQIHLLCARLLRVFAAIAPFIRLRLGNCKRACIALGFFVYLKKYARTRPERQGERLHREHGNMGVPECH